MAVLQRLQLLWNACDKGCGTTVITATVSVLQYVSLEQLFGGVAVVGKELPDASLLLFVNQPFATQAAVEGGASVQDVHDAAVYFVVVLHAHLVKQVSAGLGHALRFGLLVHDALPLLQRRGMDGIAGESSVAQLLVSQPVDAGGCLGAAFEEADGAVGTQLQNRFVVFHILMILMVVFRFNCDKYSVLASKMQIFTPFVVPFFQKEGCFCVNGCKIENICHTFLILNSLNER